MNMDHIVEFPMKQRPEGDFVRVKDDDATHYSCWNTKTQSFVEMRPK